MNHPFMHIFYAKYVRYFTSTRRPGNGSVFLFYFKQIKYKFLYKDKLNLIYILRKTLHIDIIYLCFRETIVYLHYYNGY